MTQPEVIEWCDIWVTGADSEMLPRVLFIGDSIARAYFPTVEAALHGRYHCARLSTSKSVCHPSFSRELDLVLDDYSFEIIHFNNGLHGWAYNEAAYAKGLDRALTFLRDRHQNNPLIWAQTTPVRQAENLSEYSELNDRVRERNHLAQKLAESRSIPINDLFAVVHQHPEYYVGDGVHFNAEGDAALGGQVVQCINSAVS